MEVLALALAIIGVIISVIGGIWFLVESFRASIWWGLGCLLLPFVDLIFLITHWNVVAKPFGFQIVGFVCLVAGSVITNPSYL